MAFGSAHVSARLALMMFLQYGVLGVCIGALGRQWTAAISLSAGQLTALAGTAVLAALLTPLFFATLADRHFPAQRVFAVLHLVAAVALLVLSQMESFASMLVTGAIFALCYLPTLALANGIAFRHLQNPDGNFAWLRMFGTLGGASALFATTLLGNPAGARAIVAGAAGSVVLAIAGVLLPHTPAAITRHSRTALQTFGSEAVGLLQRRSFLLLFVSAVTMGVPLAVYATCLRPFALHVNVGSPTQWLALVLVCELGALATIPRMLRSAGFKLVLAAGMVAWIAGGVLFAVAAAVAALEWLVLIGLGAVGLGGGWILVGAQMYANRVAPDALKSSAQALMVTGVCGLGLLCGGGVMTLLALRGITPANVIWVALWLLPAGLTSIVLLLFVHGFRDSGGVTLPASQ